LMRRKELTSRGVHLAVPLDLRSAVAAFALRYGIEDGGNVRATAVPGCAFCWSEKKVMLEWVCGIGIGVQLILLF
jgi:hypothetical protein